MSRGHGHLLARALPELHKARCETKELLSRWSKSRSGFVPDKKRAAKLLLEQAYASADGCLTDMQSVSSLNEAPRRDDLQKRSGQFDVHDLCNTKNALKCQLNSFACRIPGEKVERLC